MAREERGTQTQVKHRIQSDYLAAWRGIIVGGLSGVAAKRQNSGRPFRSRLVYVDGFSFKGRFDGNVGEFASNPSSDEPVWGSPVIGLRAVDAARDYALQRFGFRIETGVVLVEWDDEHFASLLESLDQAGVADRVVVNPQEIWPQDGQIVAVHADFLECYPEVIATIQDQYTKAFVLLDPYGVKGIPYEIVRQFVTLPNADVMINWPYLDILRKGGRLNHEEEQPGDWSVLGNVDAMFGTRVWREIYVPSAVMGNSALLEDNLASLYEAQLEAADATVAVKRVRLRFSEQDRTMFHLFVTTHDPTGALELNEVLDKARLWEFGLRWNLQQDRYVFRQQVAGQQSLFDMGPLRATPPVGEERRVDITQLGRDIHQKWSGQTVTRKEIYRSLVNTTVYASEIDQALTSLKKQELAQFDSRKINAAIKFVQKGGAL